MGLRPEDRAHRTGEQASLAHRRRYAQTVAHRRRRSADGSGCRGGVYERVRLDRQRPARRGPPNGSNIQEKRLVCDFRRAEFRCRESVKFGGGVEGFGVLPKFSLFSGFFFFSIRFIKHLYYIIGG